MRYFLAKLLVNQLIENVLNEAKIDLEIKRFKELGNPEMVEFLEVMKEKNISPKFIPWIAKQAQTIDIDNAGRPRPDAAAAEFLYNVIMRFDKMVRLNQFSGPEKDINQYKTRNDLLRATIKAEEKYKKKQQETVAKKGGTKKIFEDQHYLIVEPTTEEASCTYGKGTQWCISATQSKNYFQEYTSDGARFLFIINKKNNDKDAIAFAGDLRQIEIYDAEDDQRSVYYVEGKYPKHILKVINTFLNSNIGTTPFSEMSVEDFLQNPKLVADNQGDWFYRFLDPKNIEKTLDIITKVLAFYKTHLDAIENREEHWDDVRAGVRRAFYEIENAVIEQFISTGQWDEPGIIKMANYLTSLNIKEIRATPDVMKTICLFAVASQKKIPTLYNPNFLIPILLPHLEPAFQKFISGELDLDLFSTAVGFSIENNSQLPRHLSSSGRKFWHNMDNVDSDQKAILEKLIRRLYDLAVRANWDICNLVKEL